MNRIDQKFKELRTQNKKAFMPFVTAGDPNLSTTKELILAFEQAGADIIELGVPFSDPLADGPTVQASSFRSLQKGTTLVKVLKTVADIRKKSEIPIALMMYYNQIFHFGEEKFIKEAKASGVDGLIVPDLPPEEAKNLRALAKSADISTIFFLSPTTSDKRMKSNISASTGFIYFVSLAGVTGTRDQLPSSLVANVKKAKKLTDKPICVGFGVSTAEQVKTVAQVADGVIVGSAIVNQINKNAGKKDLVKQVAKFVGNLSKGL